jgi:hypothetical protein
MCRGDRKGKIMDERALRVMYSTRRRQSVGMRDERKEEKGRKRNDYIQGNSKSREREGERGYGYNLLMEIVSRYVTSFKIVNDVKRKRDIST